jgi:hypothetical protein
MFGLMVINAPRIFSTAYDSFFVQYHKVQHAFDGGSAINGVIGILQMLILVLPAIGIVATFWMIGRRVFGAVWSRTEGQPAARGAFIVASATAAAFLAYTWWPNGEYRPIQPGEKGTIQGAVQQFAKVSTGRPGLTEERERALGGAPLLSSVGQTTESPAPITSTTNQSETQTTGTETTEPTTTDSGVTVSTPAATVEVSTTNSTPTTTTPTTTTPTP